MFRAKECAAVYAIGSAGYTVLEILWRGYTHWTMSVTGGICFLFIYMSNLKLAAAKLWKKCFLGSSIITSIEFLVGLIVNRHFKWRVWDYSRNRFNLLGQICLLYSSLWFLLCIPLSFLSKGLRKRLHKPDKRS